MCTCTHACEDRLHAYIITVMIIIIIMIIIMIIIRRQQINIQTHMVAIIMIIITTIVVVIVFVRRFASLRSGLPQRRRARTQPVRAAEATLKDDFAPLRTSAYIYIYV